MLIPRHFRRLFILNQSIVEILLPCFLRRIIPLEKFYFFVQLFSVDLGYVLHHHCYVFGVERSLHHLKKYLEFLVVGCVLEDDSFAEEGSIESVKDIPSLLQSFVVVVLIGNDNSKT